MLISKSDGFCSESSYLDGEAHHHPIKYMGVQTQSIIFRNVQSSPLLTLQYTGNAIEVLNYYS